MIVLGGGRFLMCEVPIHRPTLLRERGAAPDEQGTSHVPPRPCWKSLRTKGSSPLPFFPKNLETQSSLFSVDVTMVKSHWSSYTGLCIQKNCRSPHGHPDPSLKRLVFYCRTTSASTAPCRCWRWFQFFLPSTGVPRLQENASQETAPDLTPAFS